MDGMGRANRLQKMGKRRANRPQMDSTNTKFQNYDLLSAAAVSEKDGIFNF